MAVNGAKSILFKALHTSTMQEEHCCALRDPMMCRLCVAPSLNQEDGILLKKVMRKSDVVESEMVLKRLVTICGQYRRILQDMKVLNSMSYSGVTRRERRLIRFDQRFTIITSRFSRAL